MKRFENTSFILGEENEKDKFISGEGVVFYSEDTGNLYFNSGTAIYKLGIASSTKGEPEGTESIINVVTIDTDDFDQAVIDGTLVPTTVYYLKN